MFDRCRPTLDTRHSAFEIRHLTAIALCLLAASCAWLKPRPYDDYIGPVSATRPTTQPAARPTTRPVVDIPSTGPVFISLEQALLLGLAHNGQLAVQVYRPALAATAEHSARAAFDPVVTAGLTVGQQRVDQQPADTTSRSLQANIAVSETLPTGTSVSLGATTSLSHVLDPTSDRATTRLGLTVTQALLQGYGLDVNLASLRQARLDTLISEYELRGFAEQLLAQIAQTYWNYALAERQIEIVTQSLKLAEQQLAETDERIKIGKLAETERASAQSELALRREALINARSALEAARVQFLRLINPPSQDLWNRPIVLLDRPAVPNLVLDDAEVHVAIALRRRADLNQARLAVQRGELDVVRTRNGLLPVLDLFITLGKTGYSDSFGSSVSDLFRQSYDAAAGLNFRFPPLNRDARARYTRSILSREQALESLRNFEQLVQVDIRTACIEVERTKAQIGATAVTRKYAEEALRAETEKYQVGRSTSLLVAQAQRNLLSAQINEVQAVIGYLNAIITLYRLEGSLLERHGIHAPGRETVDLSHSAWK
jgi:outer membrane protein